MKYALLMRGQHQAEDDIVARHRDDLALVKTAETLGFDAVGRAAHYSTAPLQMVSQVPFLAQAAALAPRLRLITSVVLLPMQKPLDIAEQLASLDVMSEGKLIFGAGVGYREVEFKSFGTSYKEAGRRFEENLDAVKRLWTEPSVTMKGSHFELDAASCSVSPVQKPMPPIWIGANAEVGIRRAARMADAWFIPPHGTFTTLDQQLDLYKRALEKNGKPFPADLPIIREVFVADTWEEAMRRAGPPLAAKYAAYHSWGQDKVMPSQDHFDRNFEDLAADRFLLGSPDQVAEQIVALRRRFGATWLCAGVHLAGMSHAEATEQMHRLAEQVFPLVARAGA
ncbi:MAG TPA: LLM class flavin-dependent oxidoreductase [Acetobacteraceae bacterium]|nr:LLM class flavin-dependent oxidoreductase [Acetobacteraceae bacterium]